MKNRLPARCWSAAPWQARKVIGFDTANYTFSLKQGLTRADLFNNNVFSNLNQGLLNSVPIMPGRLATLVTNLAAQGYTTAPPPGWGSNSSEVDLHNEVYAIFDGILADQIE